MKHCDELSSMKKEDTPGPNFSLGSKKKKYTKHLAIMLNKTNFGLHGAIFHGINQVNNGRAVAVG